MILLLLFTGSWLSAAPDRPAFVLAERIKETGMLDEVVCDGETSALSCCCSLPLVIWLSRTLHFCAVLLSQSEHVLTPLP